MDGLQEFFTSLLIIFAAFFDFIKSIFGIDTGNGDGDDNDDIDG